MNCVWGRDWWSPIQTAPASWRAAMNWGNKKTFLKWNIRHGRGSTKCSHIRKRGYIRPGAARQLSRQWRGGRTLSGRSLQPRPSSSGTMCAGRLGQTSAKNRDLSTKFWLTSRYGECEGTRVDRAHPLLALGWPGPGILSAWGRINIGSNWGNIKLDKASLEQIICDETHLKYFFLWFSHFFSAFFNN